MSISDWTRDQSQPGVGSYNSDKQENAENLENSSKKKNYITLDSLDLLQANKPLKNVYFQPPTN